MLLLGIYVGCLIVGGGLVMASFFTDHDSDHDFDADTDCDAGFDMDVEADVDADADITPSADTDATASVDAGEALWLPLLSLRFWLFFIFFFGLIGTILHVGKLAGPGWGTGLGIALGCGFVFGYAGSRIVQTLRKEKVSSAVDPHRDYVGKSGEVLLDIGPTDEGHVRLDAKGSSVDLPAVADGEALTRGTRIIVLGYEEGKLRVAKYDTGDEVRDRVST